MFSPFISASRHVAFGNLNRCCYARYFSLLHANLREQRPAGRSNVRTKTSVSRAVKAAHMINPGEYPLIDDTIGQLLQKAAATWPERVCVASLHQNIRLTFSELLRRVDSFAAGLKKLGLKKGDRLGIWGPNDIEWYITSLSAARLGLIVVAINPGYQQNELTYCLQKVSVKAVVSPDSFKTQNYPKMLLSAKEECPSLKHIIIVCQDHITGTRRFVDVEALPTRTEVEAIAAEQTEVSCYDECNIQFTSGSTGKPKATVLSHQSVVNNSIEGVRRTLVNANGKICCNVPFFHVFSLILVQVATFHTGDTFILEARSFDPVKSLEAIVKEGCVWTYGTPTMWINILDAQRRLQLPITSLRAGCIGGSPASPELFKRIRETLGVENILSLYGLTETTGVIFQSIYGEDKNLTETTVGHLSNHVEAMVMNENNVPVPFGTPGELWIRGYCNMTRYWDDEENTRKTLTQDGWLKTADQFILHENGYGIIVGRLKDMLIRGGENIFPKEIEDFLMTHPKVLEVQVIGAYDEVYGEEVCACVQIHDGEKITKDELREYCKGKIAHFKIPRYIEFVDQFPKTASGKIQKFRLREHLESKGVIPTTPNRS
ncbi:medium-chain acyl-CoA ligase ACSF2, mitochondrial isoform X2 [Odontomachus brunneus]|nr:medium-chain acyl-CoA ligase ACSF2, mitochondrial isoform X2 [Odontomachus brunneus]XP_032689467.1 medium-chain acyl-CoA ligase ACSF2, mitochondrial isoform X2 [Odontomachus brunneus]